jgi:predicted DNA-binding transcriptional regulator AlpA
MATPRTGADAEKLTLSPTNAAAALGVSRSQFWKLNGSGRLPAPVYLGTRAPRWRLDELRKWLAAGCPDRATWAKRAREDGE